MDKEGVKWKICALPFGGYVKIYGYDQKAIDKTIISDRAGAFFTKPLYARFLIVAAGPIANYLLAIIIFTCFYFVSGKVELPAVIGEVLTNSPAERSGLIENDKIIKIDGKIVHSFVDLQRNILTNHDQPMHLLIERKGDLITLVVTPEDIIQGSNNKSKTKRTRIGIIAKNEPVHIKMGILSSISESFVDIIDISSLILKTFGQIIIGKRSLEGIGGPVTIATESGKSLAKGPADFALFIAILSINLGLLNFLPIPILDGGQLMFIIYEAIVGKQPNQHIKNISLGFGVLVIIFLIVISISNDIKSLVF